METSLNVKSSIVTKEEVTVAKDGKIVDERSRETKENNSYSSTTSEIWEPIGVIQRPKNTNKPFDSSDDSRPNSNASSDQGYTTNTSTNNTVGAERGDCSGGVDVTLTTTGIGNNGLTTCPYCGDGVVADCPQNCCLTAMSGLGLNDTEDNIDGDGSVLSDGVKGVQIAAAMVRY